jgi:exopolysaccharide biosynthesis polyprenyl glycosylphosphotransferase
MTPTQVDPVERGSIDRQHVIASVPQSALRLVVTPLGADIPSDREEGGPLAEVLRREQIYRRLLAAADAFAATFAVVLAAIAEHVQIHWLLIGVPLLAVLIAKVQGLYDRDDMIIRKSTITEWRALIQAGALTSIGIYLAWRGVTTARRPDGMTLFVFLTLAMLLLAVPGRALARRIARAITPAERCLILGDPESNTELAARIAALDGVELIGSLRCEQLHGSVADLQHIVKELRVHRLVIAPDAQSSDVETLDLVRGAKWIGVRVSLFPSILGAVGGCAKFDELDGLTLLGIPRFGLSRSSRIVKRAFDLVGATLALVLSSPFLLGIACAIRIDTPGPVLFRQRRIGRDGLPFQIIKFRSMVDGADAMKAELSALNEASGGLFKIPNDPRITQVGRWLRSTHLDELPQLWNVLRGEMSLVGPRPLIEEEDAQITGGDRSRLRLTPGITGPWQIKGPMTTPLSEMTKLDYLYISNWSLWQDVDILLKTGLRVCDRRGV